MKIILIKYRRFTCKQITHETDISHTSVYTVLTERLSMRKIAARWFPHFLSKTEKQQRVEIFSEHGHRYMFEEENMLKRIVAIGETWSRSFGTELECQSAKWHTPNLPRPVKFCRSMKNPRILMILAHDAEGVHTTHRVPVGTTVNKEYYKSYLRKIQRPAIRRKCQVLI